MAIKITNPKMQTQEGPMSKPSGRMSKKSHVLSAREIEAYRKKKKKKDS